MASSILFFFLVVFLSYLLGARLLSLLNYEKDDFFISLGLGLGFFIYLVFGLGCCNLLYPSVILVILAILFLVSVIATIKEPRIAGPIKANREPVTNNQQVVKEKRKIKGFLLKASAFIFLFILFLTNFVSALFPPIAYDALEYHFAVPLFYIKNHKITALSTNVYSNLPFNIEILYTLGLLIKDDVVAKLIHFLFAFITAGLLFSIGRKYWSTEVGLFSAVSFLSFPISWILNLQGNVDFGITGFTALAIYTFLTWLENKENKDLILSAIFSGLALGSKITGFVILLLPLFIIIFYESFRMRKLTIEKKTVRNPFYYPLIFVSICLSLFSIWLIKNLIFTGNPVFPFLYKFLDGYNWNLSAYTKFAQAHSPAFKLPELWQKPIELISIPASKYCFAPIIFFPLLWLAKNQVQKDKSIKYLLLFTLLGYCGWFFFTHRVDRFLLPVAIPVCLLGSYAVFYPFKKTKFLKYFASTIFLVGILYNTLFQIKNSISLGNPFSENTREKFLETFLTTYPIIKYINSNLPESAKILFIAEARGYYLKRAVLLNTVFDRIIILEIAKQSTTPEDILSHLKELKITHIFYNPYELNRLEDFYGAYFDWEKHPREYQVLSAFWNKYLEKIAYYGKMELLKIKYS